MATFEDDFKFLVTRWNNSGGSHSDDLLEELIDLAAVHLGWKPKEYPSSMSWEDRWTDMTKEFNQ